MHKITYTLSLLLFGVALPLTAEEDRKGTTIPEAIIETDTVIQGGIDCAERVSKVWVEKKAEKYCDKLVEKKVHHNTRGFNEEADRRSKKTWPATPPGYGYGGYYGGYGYYGSNHYGYRGYGRPTRSRSAVIHSRHGHVRGELKNRPLPERPERTLREREAEKVPE